MYISEYPFKSAGYEIFIKSPSKADKSGGLALIVKKELKQLFAPLAEEKQPINKRIWSFEAHFPNKYMLHVVYNKNQITEIAKAIEDLKPSEGDVIIGDLNSYLDFSMDFISTSPKPKKNTQFMEKMAKNGWIDSFRAIYPDLKAYSRTGVAGKDKQYFTASRIDHILVRKGKVDNLSQAHIIEKDKCHSDHRMVITQISTETSLEPRANNGTIKVREGLKDKEKWKVFTNSLPPLDLKKTLYERSEEFKNKLLENFDKIFPEKEVTRKYWDNKIFRTKEYGELKEKKKTCYKINAHIKGVIFNGKKENYAHLEYLIEKLGVTQFPIIAKYNTSTFLDAQNLEIIYNKKIRTLLREDRKKSVEKKVEKIIEKADINGHNVFKMLREPKDSQIACLIEEDNIIIKEDLIEEKLQNTWTKIFKHETKRNDKLSEFLKYLPTPKTEPPKPNFNLENLKRIIKNKCPTAPGESKVTWQILNYCTDDYLKYLTEIFIYMYDNNLCPLSWKSGITTLIPKPGTAPSADGFRPITLLNVEYKLYTAILTESLLKWTLSNNVIPDSQNGALPDRGCDTCLWTLISTINECKKENHPLHVYYIDYSKAFDSVEHWVIEDILEHLGLGHFGYVVSSLLTSSYTRLKINNKISEKSICIEKGTKQGDVISPLLFLLFIAPCLWKLEKTCKGVEINNIKLKVAAIMDDVVLATDNIEDGKNMINIMKEFSAITGIKINPKKSAYAYANTDHKFLPESEGKYFDDLGNKKSYKYLGVWVNLDLDWTDTQEKLWGAILANTYKITKKFYIKPALMCRLINATVYAKIGYRMQVIVFEAEWLQKVKNFIRDRLNQAYKQTAKSSAPWILGYGLISLHVLNLQRYVGSLWRTLQRNENNLAKNNLLELLTRKTNRGPEGFKPAWVEPQDVLNALGLEWFHREATVHNFPPPPSDLDFPSLSHKYPVERHTIAAWSDGSLQIKKDKLYMAAGVITSEDEEWSWPIRGPPSSTEAEIQAAIGVLVTHLRTHEIVLYTDSLAAINALVMAAQNQHKNLHNSPNRTSLREFASLAKNRRVVHVGKRTHLEEPSMQLVHVHSHGDTDPEKRAKNEEKFGNLAPLHMGKNKEADKLAKKGCTRPLVPHPPSHPYADPLIIHSRNHPFACVKTLVNIATAKLTVDNYLATEPTKARRWLAENIDQVATTIPLRDNEASRQMQSFTLKILTSTLPTKHNIRKTKWYRELAEDHPKKTTYNSDKCPMCNMVESHWHTFEECEATRHHRLELVKEIEKLIQEQAEDSIPPIPWWFACRHLATTEEDVNWRGFLPHALRQYLTDVLKSAEKGDALLRKIALRFQENNIQIWEQRCRGLYPKPITPLPTTPHTAPS